MTKNHFSPDYSPLSRMFGNAIKVNGLAWSVRTAPAEAEKNVNGDFVLRQNLMNSPVIIGLNIAGFKAVKEV